MKLVYLGFLVCFHALLWSCGPVSHGAGITNGVSNNSNYRYLSKVRSGQQVSAAKPYSISNGDLGSGRIVSPQPRRLNNPLHISSGDMGSGRFKPTNISGTDLGSGRIRMNKPNFKAPMKK